MTNHYELLYLVPANYTEDELEPIKQKVKGVIGKFEGEITSEDSLGKKKLAYPVNKNNQGYYLIYQFYLEGDKLKALNNELKLTAEVLRHMIVQKRYQSPSEIKAEQERAKRRQPQVQTEPMIEAKPEQVKKDQDKDKDKIKLEDLDDKLDEILEGDIL